MAQSQRVIVLNEMIAAPPLPRLDETPVHFAPGAGPAELPEAAPETTAQPSSVPVQAVPAQEGLSQGNEILARAAAMQQAFVASMTSAQTEYLAVMTDVAEQLMGGGATAPVLRGDEALRTAYEVRGDEIFVDLHRASWLSDHRPDYGAAVLPMTCVAEILAASAQQLVPGAKVIGLRDVSLRRWIVVKDSPLRIRRIVEACGDNLFSVTLYIWRNAARAELSRDEIVASGTVILSDTYPAPPSEPAPLTDVRPSLDPYESGSLFHGPAFRLVRELWSGAEGAGAVIDVEGTSAPVGVLHPVLIDTVLQAGADMRWEDWCPEALLESGKALPLKLAEVDFFGPTPTQGVVRSELRCVGLDGGPRFPAMMYYAIADGEMWVTARLIAVGTPSGPLDHLSDADRRAYLRDRIPVPGAHLSTFETDEARLSDETVALANWIPETIEIAYELRAAQDLTRAVATKEFGARTFGVHPSDVIIEGDSVRCESRPGETLALKVTRTGGHVSVRSA